MKSIQRALGILILVTIFGLVVRESFKTVGLVGSFAVTSIREVLNPQMPANIIPPSATPVLMTTREEDDQDWLVFNHVSVWGPGNSLRFDEKYGQTLIHDATFVSPGGSWHLISYADGKATSNVMIVNAKDTLIAFDAGKMKETFVQGYACDTPVVLMFGSSDESIFFTPDRIDIHGSNWARMMSAWRFVCFQEVLPDGYIFLKGS